LQRLDAEISVRRRDPDSESLVSVPRDQFAAIEVFILSLRFAQPRFEGARIMQKSGRLVRAVELHASAPSFWRRGGKPTRTPYR
jgi:hypothetical protein